MSDTQNSLQFPRFCLNTQTARDDDPKYTYGEQPVLDMDKFEPTEFRAGNIYASYTLMSDFEFLPVDDFFLLYDSSKQQLHFMDKKLSLINDKKDPICFVPIFYIDNMTPRKVGDKKHRLPDQTRKESTVFNVTYNIFDQGNPQDTSNRFFTDKNGNTVVIFKENKFTYHFLFILKNDQSLWTKRVTLVDGKEIIEGLGFRIRNRNIFIKQLQFIYGNRNSYLKKTYRER